MHVQRLGLLQYRNYQALVLEFASGLNVFVGENAQGKTNLLESLYLLSMGKSFRTSKDADLVHWGAETARVVGHIEREPLPARVELLYRVTGPREVRVNGQLIRRTADLLGYLHAVAFTPDDLQLVKGAPALRRRFLDVELSQVSASYRHHLIEYHRVLKQRNAVLRALSERKGAKESDLELWDAPLVEYGVQIMVKRAEAVARLHELGQPLHAQISRGRDRLELIYRPFFLDERQAYHPQTLTPDALRSGFLAALRRSRRGEMARGTSLVGPQRDDMRILVNGAEAREFASQGQQRSAVLTCKLAELAYMHAEVGEYPVLLLDDVMSELDEGRRAHLLDCVAGKVQTFVTTTRLGSLPRAALADARVFHVRGGTVEAQK